MASMAGVGGSRKASKTKLISEQGKRKKNVRSKIMKKTKKTELFWPMKLKQTKKIPTYLSSWRSWSSSRLSCTGSASIATAILNQRMALAGQEMAAEIRFCLVMICRLNIFKTGADDRVISRKKNKKNKREQGGSEVKKTKAVNDGGKGVDNSQKWRSGWQSDRRKCDEILWFLTGK